MAASLPVVMSRMAGACVERITILSRLLVACGLPDAAPVEAVDAAGATEASHSGMLSAIGAAVVVVDSPLAAVVVVSPAAVVVVSSGAVVVAGASEPATVVVAAAVVLALP